MVDTKFREILVNQVKLPLRIKALGASNRQLRILNRIAADSITE